MEYNLLYICRTSRLGYMQMSLLWKMFTRNRVILLVKVLWTDVSLIEATKNSATFEDRIT